jgi:uncharacterized protein YPO0396
MTQPGPVLFAAGHGTTQWKAETLQVVNWGGFHGHARIPVAPTTTLLSGASGTGKSTLLDAYLGLMMPSDTPFNGASNDAITGRARSADQRNLLTYLRGKTDTNREAGSEELTDQVLRGADTSTWGAIAMTFIDDNTRRFTALRAYFVPLGATRPGDIIMKMATTDGTLDLRDLEPLAASRFDKRATTARFPGMNVHDSYASFAQTLYTRLGIGASGDGGKALRLLARIQGGHQIRTVDGLYKSLVLDEPATYATADRAVAHFADLDDSYTAMVTEADKARLLDRLPAIHDDYEQAQADEVMLNMIGAQRPGDSPFTLWLLRTEASLLSAAVTANRVQFRDSADTHTIACDEEKELTERLAGIDEDKKANGGERLDQLQRELDALEGKREEASRLRARFGDRTACLGISPSTAREFARCQHQAEAFLTAFGEHKQAIDEELGKVREAAYPLTVQRNDLQAEHDSLKGRTGLVPRRLHESRLAIARAVNLEPSQLPFVAELIDIAPGEEQWRNATEVTLYSAARVMLIDSLLLEHVSRTIDPIPLPSRINFQGVDLAPHHEDPGDPQYISGKLQFKDSLFSTWVRERVRRKGTDALCVSDAAELGGGGLRVTPSGQTRQGTRGAHGEISEPPIIGFSNADRIKQIAAGLTALDGQLGDLARKEQELLGRIEDLYERKDAYQHVADCDWAAIDVAGVDQQITERTAIRDAILQDSDVLQKLQAEADKLTKQLDSARRAKYTAEGEQRKLDAAHVSLLGRQQELRQRQDQIRASEAVQLTDAQTEYLDAHFTAVGNPEDLAAFNGNASRLRGRLADAARNARDQAQKAIGSLGQIFEDYQGRWPDPNLGVTMDSYNGYRDILDNIIATGLHERRQEWRRRLSEWSGQDLVPLNGAFDTAVEEIEDRLVPVNAILAGLSFGPANDRLRIELRRLHLDDVIRFRRELKELSSGVTQDLPDTEIEARFTRLRAFMTLIRKPDAGSKAPIRDIYLDVRKHVEITAARVNNAGIPVATYASLGGKSGGETQELVAFIVGSALRFQLGDEDRARPRFAPIFLDEGFIKSDSEFAGRAVSAWKGLGFQLIIGAPLDKVTALEPYTDLVLMATKSPKGYSHITELRPAGSPR